MSDVRSTPSRPWALKRSRCEAELATLARVFAADWHEGERVMTWLRRHEGRARELSRLVDDGWSWADISRAMHIAGITYRRTSEPIPPALLCRKAYEARRLVLKRLRKGEVAASPASAGATVAHALSQPALEPTSTSASPPDREEEPTFRPARLAGWSGQPTPPHEKPRETPLADANPAPTGRADAIISRLMSRR